VFAEEVVQGLFFVGGQYVGSGNPSVGVHAHVEWAVESDGESALAFIELVRADAEVGQDAVHLFGAVQAKVVFDVAEVRGDEHQVWVLRQVVLGVGILIKGVELTGRELVQDGLAMTAAAKGHVNVRPSWIDVEALKTFC